MIQGLNSAFIFTRSVRVKLLLNCYTVAAPRTHATTPVSSIRIVLWDIKEGIRKVSESTGSRQQWLEAATAAKDGRLDGHLFTEFGRLRQATWRHRSRLESAHHLHHHRHRRDCTVYIPAATTHMPHAIDHTVLPATRQNYVTKRQRENAPNVQVRLLNAQIENPDFMNFKFTNFQNVQWILFWSSVL